MSCSRSSLSVRMLVGLLGGVACGLSFGGYSVVPAVVHAAPCQGAARQAPVSAANREAYLSFQQQDFARARELAAGTLERAKSQGNRRGAGLSAANLAASLAIVGRVGEALQWYDEAEEYLREGGSRRERGRLAVARGLALYLASESDQGDRELDRARTLLGAEDWRRDFASFAIRYWADLKAGPSLQEGVGLLERARELGDKTRVAAALMAVGGLQATVGEFEEAIGLFEELESRHAATLAQRNIGVIHLRRRSFDVAEAQLMKALEQARAATDRRSEFIVLNDLSVVRAQAGDQSRAREADLQAEAVIAGLGDAIQRGRAQDTLMLDAYHLLRLRYLTMPPLLIDLFPWFFDQLGLDPAEEEE